VSVVFLCRDGLAARYIAHRLAEEDLIDAIVIEAGAAARKRKLHREWGRTPWWRVPALAIDLLALTIYGRRSARDLRWRLAGSPALSAYPEAIPTHRVDDANEAECVATLSDLAPDVLVVLGTSILKPGILAIPTRAALNIHGGVVPEYRNVHSELWAVLNGDAVNVGTTIIHLDEGIDSGAIALQERVAEAQGFFDLRWRNLRLSADLIVRALRLESQGVLPRQKQPESAAGFYRTPGVAELLRLAFTRID